MPKFEKLEEAQKAHDSLEAKVAELSEQVGKLNTENASRRKAAETLEGELKTLRESAKTEAEKAAEARLSEKHKGELAAQQQQSAKEIRGRDLLIAAHKAGIGKNAEKAVRLIADDVPAEKFGEAFGALLKDLPALADKPAISMPDSGPAGKGGGAEGTVTERLKGDAPVTISLDDARKP